MMKPRKIKEGIYWMGAADWDRKLFDALIPLPDGTSYNAYLIRGSEKTALLDAADPTKEHILFSQLESVEKLDYLISHHTEQDHSGLIPHVLERYPEAMLVTSPRGKEMLLEHLILPEERFITMEDGETLSLGDRTLEFIYTPWVHWPETISTYLREDNILFSCDFFGSHLATTDLYVTDEGRVYEAAKRYYAEIMMPFRKIIQKNLQKLEGRKIDLIAPSHGPIYRRPAFIMDAYREWVSDTPKNVVVLPYISMHGSTEKMVERMVSALAERGVTVYQFNLATFDVGKLAMSLVDAATVIIGTPTVLAGPHPNVFYATYLASVLRPRIKFASIIGSYGWGGKTVEMITNLLASLRVELLPTVICKGLPREDDFKALDGLADVIAAKHKEHNLAD